MIFSFINLYSINSVAQIGGTLSPAFHFCTVLYGIFRYFANSVILIPEQAIISLIFISPENTSFYRYNHSVTYRIVITLSYVFIIPHWGYLSTAFLFFLRNNTILLSLFVPYATIATLYSYVHCAY